MNVRIVHLFEQPEHLRLVAGWIWGEFWRDKPGVTVDTLAARLGEARDPDRVPLSLLAVEDGAPVGTVNLVHSDSETRPDLHPWLAALVVAPAARGRGIGSALVRALNAHAARLGFAELFLGTDIPAFYARLGAERVQTVRGELCIMRFALRPDGVATVGGEAR